MASDRPIIIKNYTGRKTDATEAFKKNAETMAARGYFPVTQTWQEGQWGCGSFLIALLLCLIVIGV